MWSTARRETDLTNEMSRVQLLQQETCSCLLVFEQGMELNWLLLQVKIKKNISLDYYNLCAFFFFFLHYPTIKVSVGKTLNQVQHQANLQ